MKKIFLVTVVIAAGYLLLTQTAMQNSLVTLLPSYQFDRIEKNLNDKLSQSVDDRVSVIQQGINNFQQKELILNNTIDSLLHQVDVLNKQVNSMMANTNTQAELAPKLESEPEATEVLSSEHSANSAYQIEEVASGNNTVNVAPLAKNSATNKLDNFAIKSSDSDIKQGSSVEVLNDKKLKLQRIIENMEQQSLQLLVAQ